MRTPPPSRTAKMLRISTTLVFLLLGVGSYLAAAVVEPGTARTILQSVGGFLIGTVVVGYAYQYFLGEETENRTVAKLDDVLSQKLDDIFPGAARYGFAGFATEVPRTLFNGLHSGDELLWLDTYSPDLRLFVRQLCEAVHRGADIRMLVIDPEAETAGLRACEIVDVGYDTGSFSDDTRDFLAVLTKAAADLDDAPGSLEIRCYSDLPCIPMYLRMHEGQAIDGITGYFLSEPSFDTVHIKWSSTPTGMLGGFQKYFEHKWSHAAPPLSTPPLSQSAAPPSR
jgi:hypothetical protein